MIEEARIEIDRHFRIHLVEIEVEIKVGSPSRLMQLSVVEGEESSYYSKAIWHEFWSLKVVNGCS